MKVTVLVVLVLEGLKLAVTPAGSPELVRLTFPLKPSAPITEMVLVCAEPGVRERVPAEDERVKLDSGIVTAMATEAAAPLEVPVIVAVYLPGVAVLLDVRVNLLVVLVLAGLKVAVTPFGSPESARSTLPPRLFAPATVMVLVEIDPGASITLLVEALMLKLDKEAGIWFAAEQPTTTANTGKRAMAMDNQNQRSLTWELLSVDFNAFIILPLIAARRVEMPHGDAHGCIQTLGQ